MAKQFTRVSDAENDEEVYHKTSTFYAWFHKGKHLEIFIKHGNMLFVDRDRYLAMLEQGRGNRVKRNPRAAVA